MVHLSPDSRLLDSLVKQEQAYASQLHTLLNASGTALSALAVYASSSPPTISPVLKGVASALAGVDEALLNYGEALNSWIDQLGTIKSKEEEVTTIGRDREILVTRLLKISQKSKSPPPSLLHAPPDSSSTVSFPSFGSKITTAQTELQACESQLADTERELERHRINAIRHGLKLRCEALVQCGWVWGEMGRRALSMLEDLVPPPANGHASNFYKPLPHPTHDHDRDSVRSSLTPSQSASQIGAASRPASLLHTESPYRLNIPAPYQMSEHSTIPGQSISTSREPDISNSSSEDEGPVEVHENPHFQHASVFNRQRTARTAPSTPMRSSPVPFLSPSNVHNASSDVGSPTTLTQVKHGRDRRNTGIFGSIALLFRTPMNNKSTLSSSGSKWSSRTGRNLRSVKTDGENSSSEDVPRLGRLRKAKARSTSRHDTGWTSATLTNPGAGPLSMPSPPTPLVRTKKPAGGKSNKSDLGDSMGIEPASAPRGRANSLTPSSSGGVLVDVHGQIARGHGKRVSLDGRWGLADPGTMGASHGGSSSPVWKPPKQPAASKAGSLMSIIEGASHSAHNNDPSSRLEVVRAPSNVITSLPLLVNHPPPLPATTSTVQMSDAEKRLSLPNLSTALSKQNSLSTREKKPLRSAMRNPNRDRSTSPSPSTSPNGIVAETVPPSLTVSPLSLPGPASPPLRPFSISRAEIPSTIIESPRQSVASMMISQINTNRQSAISTKTDDSASISSYETGHEDFEDEGLELTVQTKPVTTPTNEKVELPPQPFAMPNQSPLNGVSEGLTSNKHELSSATSTDTATGATPSRRKSVRMSSLPPQFSATPPALEDDEDRSPWGGSSTKPLERDEGWKTRTLINSVSWDDSSSEDEVYKGARKALSRAERRLEKSKAR